ncbi:hypothetical protein EsH8_XIII_000026 [Colletotrichum jinshuiense]
MAYLDSSELRAARKRFVKQSCGHWNRITRSLHATRLAALTPAQGTHDPYIAAIVVAAAQHQQRSGPYEGMASIQVHVVFSDADDTSQLLVYTASVSRSFLDKLAHTRRRPLPSAAFRIHTSAIPYQPFASFQQRFHQALLTSRATGREHQETDGEEADKERDGYTARKRVRINHDGENPNQDGSGPRKRARMGWDENEDSQLAARD